MISFFQEDVSLSQLDEEVIGVWLNEVVETEGNLLGDLNIIFCSDEYLLDINKQYLQHDYFTDIITFDYTEGSIIAGDLFISIHRVEENSKQFSVSFDLELRRICVHGVLHLLGFKDKSSEDKEMMTSKEDFYLKKIK